MTLCSIPTTTVRTLCLARIQWADEARDKDIAELIEANRYPAWRRILGLPPRTPERSLELLEKEDRRSTFFGYHLTEIRFRHACATRRADRLLSAASITSESSMFVDSDDAAVLMNWQLTLERRAKATTQATTVAA